MALILHDYDTYHHHTCSYNSALCEWTYQSRHCSIVSFGLSSDSRSADTVRGIGGLFQFRCHYDGGTLRRGRRHPSDGHCQGGEPEDCPHGAWQRNCHVPAGNHCHGCHRSLRQQHGDRSPDDANSGIDGCPGRKESVENAHANGVCQQHGRNADTHRNTAQPCYRRDPSGAWI